jgi:hypothetical protein
MTRMRFAAIDGVGVDCRPEDQAGICGFYRSLAFAMRG